ncbi:hypothetical protein CJ030_MR0G025470 [Morella rubra]|uniref:Uncharacterized protein n=1 Tax=Morella rubra TaxID=262757 RepID=A0A6A1UGA9_9ROSI|nr:hypothetical protein CJ030_MR0G025462 [Morella rubra]KAB1199283.1 hypothetical protein CJ030_MR0G025470 [Morella rubra]
MAEPVRDVNLNREQGQTTSRSNAAEVLRSLAGFMAQQMNQNPNHHEERIEGCSFDQFNRQHLMEIKVEGSVQVPIGPVTRARAKKFKDVLNGLVQELWVQANLWKPIEHDPRGPQRMLTLIQVLERSLF